MGGEGAESGEGKQEKVEKPVKPPESQLDQRLQVSDHNNLIYWCIMKGVSEDTGK